MIMIMPITMIVIITIMMIRTWLNIISRLNFVLSLSLFKIKLKQNPLRPQALQVSR